MIRLLSSIFFVMTTHSACAADIDQNTGAPFSAYLTALAATSHGAATVEDVERVLSFYAGDIVYEHPRVGIRLEGLEAQRQGLTAFLASYAGGAADSTIDVIDHVEGTGFVMLNLKVRFLQRREDAIEEVSRDHWRLMETNDGKISRIIDYW